MDNLCNAFLVVSYGIILTMLAIKWRLRLIYVIFMVFFITFQNHLVTSQEEEAQSSIIASLIYGLGIPWDVQGGFLTTGYVVRVPYAFPMKIKEWKSPYAKYFKKRRSTRATNDTSTSHIRHKAMIGPAIKRNGIKSNNQKPTMDMGKYRWAAYYALEVHATRLGYDGRACMLRAICEAATVSFNWKSGLLGEILHILLTPSTTEDPLTKYSDNEYLHAEYLGETGAPCDRIFKECTKSLLDEFSSVYVENLKLKM